MSNETIKTYLLNDPETALPMEREAFYKEQIEAFTKTGKPTRACDIVDIFIFNTHGELIVQKRSYDKAHNAGLLDKSIGGHVRFEDSADYTVMVETVQELQTPSIVLKNRKDFQKTLTLLGDYLTTISILRHSHSKIYFLDKIIHDKKIVIANKVHAFFGIYDGSIRPVDREAKGILYYTLDELAAELRQFPDTFTHDMHVLFAELRPEIEEFLRTYQSHQHEKQ